MGEGARVIALDAGTLIKIGGGGQQSRTRSRRGGELTGRRHRIRQVQSRRPSLRMRQTRLRWTSRPFQAIRPSSGQMIGQTAKTIRELSLPIESTPICSASSENPMTRIGDFRQDISIGGRPL